MSAAGYSGTPPAKKVGVKPGHRLALVHRPDGWQLPDLPAGVTVADGGDADVVIAFYWAQVELDADLPAIATGLPKGSMLWVAWPRRAGGHTSDLTDNSVRAALLPTGLVDIKVAALDTDWSALKFVWRKSPRL